MIASSTNRPSASTSAPARSYCGPMPNQCIAAKVIASTSRDLTATTSPVRRPSEEEADQQHDRHRLAERARTRRPNRAPHAAGRTPCASSMPAGSALRARELGFQRIAQAQDVAAVLHRHRDRRPSPAKRQLRGAAGRRSRLCTVAMSPRAHRAGRRRGSEFAQFVDRRNARPSLHAVRRGLEARRPPRSVRPAPAGPRTTGCWQSSPA